MKRKKQRGACFPMGQTMIAVIADIFKVEDNEVIRDVMAM